MEAENRIGKSHRFREVQGSYSGAKGIVRPAIVKRVGTIFVIAVGAFMLGYGAMWVSSKQDETELKAIVEKLRPSVLQNDLATAAINAQQGDFEQARLQASAFFTDLRAELERDNSAFGPSEDQAVRSIISQRDETITMLARKDPASADHLAKMYFKFMLAKNATVAADKQNSPSF
jgi:hypothetical protein